MARPGQGAGRDCPTADVPGKSGKNLAAPGDTVGMCSSSFGIIGVSSKRSSQSTSPTGSEAAVDINHG